MSEHILEQPDYELLYKCAYAVSVVVFGVLVYKEFFSRPEPPLEYHTYQLEDVLRTNRHLDSKSPIEMDYQWWRATLDANISDNDQLLHINFVCKHSGLEITTDW